MSGPTLIGSMPGLAPEFLDAVVGMKLSRYGAAVATTLCIYDILITLDLEVAYTWPKLAFSLPMVFYILNRYISLGFFLFFIHGLSDLHGPLSDTYCRMPFMNISIILGHVSWTGMMALRVCALWKQQTKLVVVIWSLWAPTNIAVVICAALAFTYQLLLFSYHEEFQACIPDKPTMNGLELAGPYGPVAPLIFETFLVALTIIKAFNFPSQASRAFRFSFRTLPFIYRIIARDGVLYFLVTIVVTMVILVVSFTHPGPQIYFFLIIYWSLLSTVISRLALNLRQSYFESQQITTTVSFGITNVTDGANADFGVSADFDRRCTTTLDDLDVQMTHIRLSGAEVEQNASSTDPSLAMRRLCPRQDGIGAV